MRRIAVLGIGNVLMGDDALGAHVVKLLDARYELPPEVELRELGTPGPDLPLHLEGLDVAIVVDVVKMKGAPGELRVLDKADLLGRSPVLPASPHEPGLREALFSLEFRGGAPARVRVVGVVPAVVDMVIGLSPAVTASVPAALDAVLRELDAVGAPVRLRDIPRAPDLWWERRHGGET